MKVIVWWKWGLGLGLGVYVCFSGDDDVVEKGDGVVFFWWLMIWVCELVSEGMWRWCVVRGDFFFVI